MTFTCKFQVTSLMMKFAELSSGCYKCKLCISYIELLIMSPVDRRSVVPFLQARTHQEVFWFYISVDNIETVQVLDGTGQVEEHAAGISLCVLVRGDDCIKEITALEKQ